MSARSSIQTRDFVKHVSTVHYHFVTRWRVEGTPEEVHRVIEDVEAFRRRVISSCG
jgi:hypothetical protein